MTKSPPIRRNVSPSTEPPKDPEWFGKVTKVERQKSTGRKRRYRRVNPEEWEHAQVDGGKKRTNTRRNVKRSETSRKLLYMLAGAALVIIGYLLARM